MSEVYDAALKLLTRRDHAVFELRQKLLEKNFDSDAIKIVLSQLIAEGYLSDERFAVMYARYRAERGFGPVRIRGELRERGVNDDVIQTALLTFEDSWSARAEVVRIKRFGKNFPRDFAARAKQMKFLQYRGFLPDHSKSIIKGSEELS